MTKTKIKKYFALLIRRAGAGLLDLAIVLSLVMFVIMAVVWSFNQNGWIHNLAVNFCQREEPLLFLNACVSKISPWVILSIGYLAILFFSIIYVIIMIVWKRRTIGKMVFGLEVVDRNDHKPGLYTLLTREVFARLIIYIFPIIQLTIFSPTGETIVDKIFKLKIRIEK